MTNVDFDDAIPFGDELTAVIDAPLRTAPAPIAEKPLHFERCWKCGGSGQTRWGTCFACQGKGGKSYKQPAAVRGAARMQAGERKARSQAENLEAFQAAFPAEWLWVCERVQWELTKAQNGQDFGQSLLAAITKYGDLSEGRMEAIRRNMAKRAAAIEARATAPAPAISVERIEQAFAKAAATGLKKLHLSLATTKIDGTKIVDGVEVPNEVLKHAFTFKPAKKYAGTLYVTEGDEYLGKIVAGRFQCVAACGDERRDDVVKAASDPAQAAVAYGKVLGRCSVCSAELTNPESVARSMGPICAERYGF